MTAKHDVLFIGTGASSTHSLIYLLEKAIEQNVALSICLTDRSDTFYTGIAYGPRSGLHALTITTLEDFLPQPELNLYLEWLEHNRTKIKCPVALDQKDQSMLTSPQESLSGYLSLQELKKICVCRRSFGEYMVARVNALIQRAQSKNLLTLSTVVGEVQDLSVQEDNTYQCVVHGADNSTTDITAARVVLGIGGAPTRGFSQLNAESDITFQLPAQKIINLYERDFESDLSLVAEQLQSGNSNVASVLLVGSNASALEVLFYLWQKHRQAALSFKIDLVSLLGNLPALHGMAEIDEQLDGDTRWPDGLATISAKQLNEWSLETLKEGEKRKLSLAAYAGLVNRRIFEALGTMPADQALAFLRNYANGLGRYQRKAENPYKYASQDLIDAGILSVNAGAVSIHHVSESGVAVSIENNSDIQHRTYDLVLNCMGSEYVDETSTMPLIRNILSKGLAESADGQAGFIVDESFRTKGGIYVIGPMMSGNYVKGQPVWHMEHMGRIQQFSALLADDLIRDIVA